MAITYQQFSNIATQNGFRQPSQTKYGHFVTASNDRRWGISDRQEIAMFLAHILQETGGFQLLVENGRPSGYDKSVGHPGKEYYGRGYIHLSHSYNYKAASEGLFNDSQKLLQCPELVENNEEIAWKTAFWFWHANVRNQPGFAQYRFGVTTRAINSMECTNPCYHNKARNRFGFYRTNLRVLGLTVEPDESGCYN